jgi:uroporphyrinogen decarboxylase
VNDRFLKACRREPVDATPVWFMRQAGRYLPQYRALRDKYSLLELCRHPELAVEVTLQPLDVIDVDAAILFSDLLLPFTPMGLDFDFVKGEGPAIAQPIRSAADVDRLRRFESRESLAHVLEAIRLLRPALVNRVPLIGFGGAPFTLASYAIEGGPSRDYLRTKSMMYSEPRAWHRLCGLFADAIADFLRAQIEAGVQAVQVFDSWVGALSVADYREFALPHTTRIFDRLAGTGVPTIHFGVGTTALLGELARAGGDVIGVDWRQPLDEAWATLGSDRGIQGNLDPTTLFGPEDRLLAAADDILRRAAGRAGHIFNLGHGVLPATPVERLQSLARHVHAARPEPCASLSPES